MFENITKFFKKFSKKENPKDSSVAAKERLHLVLMQDRANVSADFLELMRQEIIEVIKKYIEIDEKAIDVKLTNKTNDDGTVGAPALYANIPIITIKNEARKLNVAPPSPNKEEKKKEEAEDKKENKNSKTTNKNSKKANSNDDDKNKTNIKKEEGNKKEQKQAEEQSKINEQVEKTTEETKNEKEQEEKTSDEIEKQENVNKMKVNS